MATPDTRGPAGLKAAEAEKRKGLRDLIDRRIAAGRRAKTSTVSMGLDELKDIAEALR